jgi:hypothetical protein
MLSSGTRCVQRGNWKKGRIVGSEEAVVNSEEGADRSLAAIKNIHLSTNNRVAVAEVTVAPNSCE